MLNVRKLVYNKITIISWQYQLYIPAHKSSSGEFKTGSFLTIGIPFESLVWGELIERKMLGFRCFKSGLQLSFC